MRPKTQGRPYPNETPDFKEGRALRDYQVECPSSHSVSHCVSLAVSLTMPCLPLTVTVARRGSPHRLSDRLCTATARWTASSG
jgi:hypothetical protein